mmetsp:Transcript_38636/g.77353  ORF Transcript_38636/g.77353 Transcript_38636/m.77353 type:complete len:229 (-) Transcript_38636:858-1544(-)
MDATTRQACCNALWGVGGASAMLDSQGRRGGGYSAEGPAPRHPSTLYPAPSHPCTLHPAPSHPSTLQSFTLKQSAGWCKVQGARCRPPQAAACCSAAACSAARRAAARATRPALLSASVPGPEEPAPPRGLPEAAIARSMAASSESSCQRRRARASVSLTGKDGAKPSSLTMSCMPQPTGSCAVEMRVSFGKISCSFSIASWSSTVGKSNMPNMMSTPPGRSNLRDML